MNMLYTQDHEPESLKMLRQAPELFPQANQCITAHTRKQQTAQPSVVNRTEGTQAGAPAARMEVIWAGREDDKNNRIVCVLMSYTESTLNAYTARVIDQGGKEIAVSSFVSFERDIAFATMLVPIDIFDECSVQMYFPSAGVITIQGVELQDADMDLSLWDAAKGKKVECSTPKKLHVEDSVITYCFAEKWEGKKLSDCYDLGRSNTNVKYLLTVKALEKTGKSIELTITNEASILGGGGGGEG